MHAGKSLNFIGNQFSITVTALEYMIQPRALVTVQIYKHCHFSSCMELLKYTWIGSTVCCITCNTVGCIILICYKRCGLADHNVVENVNNIQSLSFFLFFRRITTS